MTDESIAAADPLRKAALALFKHMMWGTSMHGVPFYLVDDLRVALIATESRASPEVLRAPSGSLSEAEERAAFETWWTTTPEWAPEFDIHKAWVTNLAYWAWQRRAALSPSGPMISLDAALGCVPGGSVCDPQVIADSLRELVAAEPRSPSPDLSTRNTEGLLETRKGRKPALICSGCGLIRVFGTGPCDECGVSGFSPWDKASHE